MSSPLIDVESLSEVLDQVVLVDLRYWMGQPGRGPDAWQQGHLPGAHFVDLDLELASPLRDDPSARPGTHPGGRHPLPSAEQVQRLVERLGIDPGSSVVCYDQSNGFAASRLWWVLRDAGHEDIRVLDGGYEAWVASGRPVVTGAVEDGHGTFVVRPGHLPVVTTDEVEDHLARGHRLIDVRGAERHAGITEPVDPIAGHIPGAGNLPMDSLLHEGSRLLPASELRQILKGLDEADAFSCGSGITAGHALLAAAVAGVGPTVLHPGSYSDWISNPSRPVANSEGIHS